MQIQQITSMEKKTDVKIERNLVKPPNSRREKNAGSHVCIVADKDDEL